VTLIPAPTTSLCNGYVRFNPDQTEDHFALFHDGTILHCLTHSPNTHFFKEPDGSLPERISTLSEMPDEEYAEYIGQYDSNLTRTP
jgi:hypothetical protein